MKNFSQQPTVDYDIPTNVPYLYQDSIEDKNFTQIKVDLFANVIKKNIDSFVRARGEIQAKIAGK